MNDNYIDLFIDTIKHNEEDNSTNVLCMCPMCGDTVAELTIQHNIKTIICMSCGITDIDNIGKMSLDGYVN